MIKYFFSIAILLILIICLFFFSPDSASENIRLFISEKLNNYFCNINEKVQNNSCHYFDYLAVKIFYKSMIFFGHIFYPEASRILNHYLFGDGKDLFIDASYFKKNKIIKKILYNKKPGRYGPIGINIKDNPRIAYAINPFYLNIRKNEGYLSYTIYQTIKFDKKDKFTIFYIGRLHFNIPDNLVYIFEKKGGCKPFNVYIKWKVKK